ncbi:MAG TPA: c-type cytochrome [Casimicrobiaceae bacterium]|nr:c-type cytochrome [Casimicrobiaceae bacterium]
MALPSTHPTTLTRSVRALTVPATLVRFLRAFAVAAMLPLLPGCEKAMQDMYNQPKFKPLAASTLWGDGRSARPEVRGAVAYSAGALAGTSSGRLGELPAPASEAPTYPVDDNGQIRANLTPDAPRPTLATNPLPITRATLERGRERFDIYCAPCHSVAGDGDGMVVRRGFPSPPSYHTDRLRKAPDAHFYSVITNGYGVMYAYADRVAPADRWAIVAYIRALQLSQSARIGDVPAARRQALERTSR